MTLSPTSLQVTGSSPVTQALTISVAGTVQPGNYPLKVRATGGNISREADLSLTVTIPPSFTLSLNPTGLTLDQGASGGVEVRLQRQGFTGPVSLSLEGSPLLSTTPAPDRIAWSFSPNPAPGDRSTLTLQVGRGVAPGTYTLKVRATGGNISREADLVLTVTQPNQSGFPLQFGTSQNDGVWNLTVEGDYIYAIASVNGDAPGSPTSPSAHGVLLKISRNGEILFQVPFGQGRGLRTIGVAVDDQGFIYASAEGTLQGRDREVFLYKFSADGRLLWEKSIGTPAEDGVGKMLFSSGHLYIVGNTRGSFPGHTNAGHFDAWIAKLDREGNPVWVRQLGTGGWDGFGSITVDENGHLYVTGIVSGPLLGNPYSGAYHDIPVVKFSPNGEILWARQFTAGGGWQGGSGIYARGGRVYIVGGTHGSLPGYRNPGCGADAYLVTFDYQGNRLDHYQFGTAGDDVATAISVDNQGRVFVGGWAGAWCRGAFPGETPKGDRDAFVAQVDPDQKRLVWVRQFGGPLEDWGVWGLATDNQGGVYFGGFVNTGLGGNSHQGGQDAFVDMVRP
ncbi:hypothetical protein [Thermus sp.]|uniref:hypothetical protein n=1 Tax=Thermus sp. TaxID=275 RepID=UPI0025EA9DB6|nr:hypothetical protein [Thermus sp.]MCS6867800.1 hypothetical protein [Thermus sp.]